MVSIHHMYDILEPGKRVEDMSIATPGVSKCSISVHHTHDIWESYKCGNGF